jgi:flagellar biosynthesis/type III secretory pathway protein FliH
MNITEEVSPPTVEEHYEAEKVEAEFTRTQEPDEVQEVEETPLTEADLQQAFEDGRKLGVGEAAELNSQLVEGLRSVTQKLEEVSFREVKLDNFLVDLALIVSKSLFHSSLIEGRELVVRHVEGIVKAAELPLDAPLEVKLHSELAATLSAEQGAQDLNWIITPDDSLDIGDVQVSLGPALLSYSVDEALAVARSQLLDQALQPDD